MKHSRVHYYGDSHWRVVVTTSYLACTNLTRNRLQYYVFSSFMSVSLCICVTESLFFSYKCPVSLLMSSYTKLCIWFESTTPSLLIWSNFYYFVTFSPSVFLSLILHFFTSQTASSHSYNFHYKNHSIYSDHILQPLLYFCVPRFPPLLWYIWFPHFCGTFSWKIRANILVYYHPVKSIIYSFNIIFSIKWQFVQKMKY